MINRLKVGIFSLCLITTLAFRADAQQATAPAAGGSEESRKLRLEIKTLSVQEARLDGQIKTYHDQITPLYDQFRQITSEIKQIQEQFKPINDQINDIQTKIKIDQDKLKKLPK